MDKKKEENIKPENTKKEEKIDTKAFNKVDSKTKKEDVFSSIDEKNKEAKGKEVKKDNKGKNTSKEEVKGTVTVNKKVEEKPKEKVKSSGKKGKWITLVIALICIVAIIVGIIFFMNTPYYAVSKAFKAIKGGNINAINKYVSYDSLMDSVTGSLDVGEEMSEFEKNCFSEFTFKINTVKVEGENATVNVDTTNKNFRNAVTKWTQSIYQKFINGEDISNDQGITLLNDCLSDSSIGTITTNKDITLTKVEGKWKINVTDELIDAIFPGMSEVVNSIEALTE